MDKRRNGAGRALCLRASGHGSSHGRGPIRLTKRRVMGSKDRLAFCGALLMVVSTAASFCFDQVPGHPIERRRALSDLIPHSMMPSADLPLVDITTEKIPNGMTERGTSFYVGNDLWMSARHVINGECAHIIMIVGGKNVEAQTTYLDDNADIAVVHAQVPRVVPALPIE